MEEEQEKASQLRQRRALWQNERIRQSSGSGSGSGSSYGLGFGFRFGFGLGLGASIVIALSRVVVRTMRRETKDGGRGGGALYIAKKMVKELDIPRHSGASDEKEVEAW